jgi:hypothetical protein
MCITCQRRSFLDRRSLYRRASFCLCVALYFCPRCVFSPLHQQARADKTKRRRVGMDDQSTVGGDGMTADGAACKCSGKAYEDPAAKSAAELMVRGVQSVNMVASTLRFALRPTNRRRRVVVSFAPDLSFIDVPLLASPLWTFTTGSF